ncbi:MAG TPA: DNA repair protein RecN, partial [Actinomycetota bacterium]|nr:DNA repair protein RecN [Actinomycetota bacterium]
EESRRELAELEGAEDRLAELAGEVTQAHARLLEAGEALSKARREAAEGLSAEATREIRFLGMPEARFEVGLIPLAEPGPEGLEEVQLLFSANPGLNLAPLEKAASGGELSRVMLALALLTGSEAPTVVFDEVDTGVGGEAAWRVAERLARLAQQRQVLVVTHLPQIAAFADRHVLIRKRAGAARARPLGDEERIAELSRMLSGLPGSERAALHAEELLAEAGRAKRGR